MINDLGTAVAYVLGMSPYAQDAAIHYRDAQREFAVQMFNLLAGIVVLLITALGVSIIYCRRNVQTLFVKYLAGWRFLLTHWKILAVETALGLVLVLWVWNTAAVALERRDMPGAPPASAGDLVLNHWKPLAAVGIAVVSLAFVVSTLWRTNHKFVKVHSSVISWVARRKKRF